MHNLLNLIKKFHYFLLFVLLEVIALFLTLNNQQYQQSLYLHSANALSARIYKLSDQVTSYFSLKDVNRALLLEYEQLLNSKPWNFTTHDTNIYVGQDPTSQRRYTYMHAEVINNSIIRRNNYITLNKGYKHGIQPDMGVITPNGVAGIIMHVSENFSVAMSLLHSDMLVSAKIVKSDQLGTLSWEGIDYRMASMTYIPPHLKLNVGDSIVTSGFSTVFPENIFIGTIQNWEIRRGENFITAGIELALDFNQLSYVYVVQNLFKDELDELESRVFID